MDKDNISVDPKIQVLSKEQIERVHNYSIQILENIGIKVESKRARDFFASTGTTKIDGELVYIQREMVDQAIKTAQSEISIFNQHGDLAFQLGNEHSTRFGIGVTNTNYQDVVTDKIDVFKRKHTKEGVRLGDLLDNFDMISTIGIPFDVPTEQLDLLNSLDLYANTSKPLVILVSEGKRMDDVFKLLSFLHGDISSKPFIIPYFNPITPLVLNEDTTDKMFSTIEYGLPISYSNYSMYGGTTPMTEGGTLALMNAELLAGLVFSQIVKEGTPIILGSLPAGFNMVTMGSYYSPSSYLINLSCAEMMNYYHIPHCGTSGSGTGFGPDLLAAGDLWLNHLTSCMGKVGMAPFVGGNFDSTAFSPTTVVMSDYIIGKSRSFSKGFVLNDETVNLQEMGSIGHGGNYLTSGQTLDALGSFGQSNALWPSMSLETWQGRGNPTPKKMLKNYTKILLEQAGTKSAEVEDVIKKGEDYIKRLL
jgi:trimethylamine--corrinoid protein Co-methyltransferase